MYERFYGFREKPFSKTPDPRFLFLSRDHREALARLQYGVEEKEIVLITGEVGCGKTTISRSLLDALDESYLPIVIVNPVLEPGELIRYFARRIGIDEPSGFKTDLMEQIGERLFDLFQRKITPLLVVDEAQLIPGREGLDEIRLLTNIQLDDANMFSIILLGQPELRGRLLSGYFDPLRQRIGLQYHINPLDMDEMADYIDFRLRTAGREEPIFTTDAVAELYRFSGGVPRKINNLASGSILVGFGREEKLIDADIILLVAKDFGLI